MSNGMKSSSWKSSSLQVTGYPEMNMVLAKSGVRRFMANPVGLGSRKNTAPGRIITVVAVVVAAAVVVVATTIIAAHDRTSRLLAVAAQPDLLVF
jgi:hypothetical protein